VKGKRGISKEEIPVVLFRMAGIFYLGAYYELQLFTSPNCYIRKSENLYSNR